jgi:Dolichyl-phosphate-mannose-protein mannosyltransferase
VTVDAQVSPANDGQTAAAPRLRPRRRPGSLIRGCARLHTLGWLWSSAIVAAALALRFAYLPVAAADPTFDHPFLDALWNVQHASAIAHGQLAAPHPFYRAPLYTYFLGGVLLSTGGRLLWAHIVQLVIGSLTALLVGTLAARLLGRGVGALAGLLFAATATIVFFDFELVNAIVFLPLVVIALLALERAMRAPSLSRVLAVGVALGLAALARPDILVFTPVAAAVAFAASRRAGWGMVRTAAACAVLGAGLALPIAPVTAYNALVGRDAVLISSQGGAILYVCNNPGADGLAPVMPGPTDTASYAADGTYTDNIESSSRYLARLALGHEPKPSEVSRYWTRRALAWITGHPLAWGRLVLRRAFYLIGGFEIGDQKNLAYYLAAWGPFAFLPRWWWLFPLAVAGLTFPGDRRARLLLAAFALAYGAVLVAFVPVERFRLALYPVVCILAARFIIAGVSSMQARRWRDLALRGALVAALIAVTTWDPTGYTRHERIEAAIARAFDNEAHADPARAERLLLEALAIDPTSRRARTAYAAFLDRHGRPAEARALTGGPR